MIETALERFIRYVKIDTQSQEGSDSYPSTKKQFDLLNLLVNELKELGIKDVEIDEHGYVFATIPANIPGSHPAFGKVPVIGFLAHVDTSPDSSGKDVKPNIIENYQGGDIVLPGNKDIIIKISENKKLKDCAGHTIITSDGTTLLGADDKAGIAAIMTLAQTLANDNSILHGDIRIGFTPDEEIGQGTKYFDIKKFGAQFAYTIDGEMPGELNKETFSANSAIITIEGRDIHPGTAKNIMVNSIRAMAEIIARLPKDMAPETTEKYEPYIHPHTTEGSVSKATIKFLLRDFITAGLIDQKIILENIIQEVQAMYPKAKFNLEIIEMYRNMREKLDANPLVLECLWEAAEQAGANPYWEPIRGGTDGSRLTEMGLPTPNIYGGGQNFHSVTEWLSVDAMNLTIKTLVNLVQIWVRKSQ